MRVAGHVELARHVAVLHEGVVQPLPRPHVPAQQLAVVRLGGVVGVAEQAAVVPRPVHLAHPRHALPVPHGGLRVEAGGAERVRHTEAAALALQLVQLGVGGGGEAAEAGEAPRGLLIEMDPRFWRGGDVLGHGNITRAAND